MKEVYKCEYISRYDPYNEYREGDHTRHLVRLHEHHKRFGGRAGEICNTSGDIFFSPEHGVLVTYNSVYIFEPRKD